MTQIVVSKRDGIATEPNGTKHRVARGKTLADARHPLVLAHPGDWLPMEIALPMPDAEGGAPAGELSQAEQLSCENELSSLEHALAEAEATVEAYRAQLAAVVEVLVNNDLMPPDAGATEGWLVRAVEAAVVAKRAGLSEGELPIDEPLRPASSVPPPKTPRAAKRVPRADS